MPVMEWNYDKKHRCPQCHAVTDPDHKSKWKVVECHRCTSEFTRWPRLARFLPKMKGGWPDV